MKLRKISLLITPSTANVKSRVLVFILTSTKLRAPNPLDKIMQLVSLEPHTDDLDKGKVIDLDKSQRTCPVEY